MISKTHENEWDFLGKWLGFRTEPFCSSWLWVRFENDFFMFPAYQESAAEFFLAESKLTSKEKAEEGFFKSAEKNLQKYISQMLGMARPTTFTNDEGDQHHVASAEGSGFAMVARTEYLLSVSLLQVAHVRQMSRASGET